MRQWKTTDRGRSEGTANGAAAPGNGVKAAAAGSKISNLNKIKFFYVQQFLKGVEK